MTKRGVPRNDRGGGLVIATFLMSLQPFLLSLRAEGVAIPGKAKLKNQNVE